MLNVVFMGSPKFAADILTELAEQNDVICVYTQPDKVRGRGKKLQPTPVKEVAENLGIEVRTPPTLRDGETVNRLAELEPDIICVAAYGMILPKTVLDIPKYGCINVHASLLPRWRGAAPIEKAILAGDEQVGVCIMRMEEGMDTGAFCITRSIPVDKKSATELTDELASLGAVALISALSQIEAGNDRWIEQDEGHATYAPKIAKGELNLDPEASAETNLRRVRASSALHPSKANIAGRDVNVEAASAASPDTSAAAGEPVAGAAKAVGKMLLLGCSDGWLEVEQLKPAGKNSMPASSFLTGTNLDDASSWSAA